MNRRWVFQEKILENMVAVFFCFLGGLTECPLSGSVGDKMGGIGTTLNGLPGRRDVCDSRLKTCLLSLHLYGLEFLHPFQPSPTSRPLLPTSLDEFNLFK